MTSGGIDSTYAEYAKVPLENVYALDEERLLGDSAKGGLGYTVEDLPYMYRLLVPFGGFRDVDLKVGETILIGPATGPYGTAAVSLALALGANVVAMGRNGQVLEKLAATSERVKTVQLTGDVKTDTAAIKQHGPIDVFFDSSPSGGGVLDTHHERDSVPCAFGKGEFDGGHCGGDFDSLWSGHV